MTRFLLDTNVLSEAIRSVPSTLLVDWLGAQDDRDLYISVLTVAEIRRGILEKSHGRKRQALQTWFDGAEGPQQLFRGRVLAFDEPAALEWARIMAAGRASGRSRSALDMIIAATAAANQCVVVTANESHFSGVIEFLNPLRQAR